MNTLDDLRSALRHQAGTVDDPTPYARPVAVRERVRVARRRRAAVAASAAVVVLAAGATVVGTVLDRPHQVDPATQVVGVDVPERVTVLGFPYELSGSDPLEGERDRLRLAGGDGHQWRAVSLVASGLGDGYATLLVDDQPVARASGSEDVEVPVPVYDGEPMLRVRLDGAPSDARVGVAVYGATGALPEGVTDGTAVFRRDVAGGHLLAGAFSERGDPAVRVAFTGELADTRIAYYCESAEKGLWLNIETDAQGALGTSCSAHDDVDAGDGGAALTGRSAGRHVLDAYLTRGADGPRVPDADAVVGVAAYAEPAQERSVLGMRVPAVVELNGRSWVLDHVVPQDRPGDPVRTTVDASDGDRLLGQVAAGGTTWIDWRGRLLDGESTRMGSASGVDGAGRLTDTYLPRGDTYQVALVGGRDSSFRGALLVYRPM